ncbi:MAG: hypothetical protein AB1402_10025 [Bacillota bacterium]
MILALALMPGLAFGTEKEYKSREEFRGVMAGLSFAEAKIGANQDIRQVYGLMLDHHQDRSEHGNHAANPDLWGNRHVFTYGQPHEYDQGHHRYLGYTFEETKYTNTLFRHDAWAGGWFTSRNWIAEPWEDGRVAQFLSGRGEPRILSSRFNRADSSDPVFEMLSQSAFLGALAVVSDQGPVATVPGFTLNKEWLEFLDRMDFGHEGIVLIYKYCEDDEFITNLAKYIHVLDPPTSVSFGMGRMFHQLRDGRIFYLTIPLFPTSFKLPPPPVRPDFSVELIPNRFEGQNGQALSGTVRYRLNEDHPQAETAWLRLHHVAGAEHAINLQPVVPADAPNAQGHVLFQPGDVKEYRYSFTVQAASEMILARINPVQGQDKNWSNNRAEAPILRPCTDISVKLSQHPAGKRFVGDNTQLTAVVTRGRDGPAGPVGVRFRFGHGSWQNFTLAQGQSRTFSDVVRHDRAGNVTYSAEAWPVGIEDCNPANNRAEARVRVEERLEFEIPDSPLRYEIIS